MTATIVLYTDYHAGCQAAVSVVKPTEEEIRGPLWAKYGRSLPGLNNIINLAPALVATRADIDRIVLAIRNAIAKVSS